MRLSSLKLQAGETTAVEEDDTGAEKPGAHLMCCQCCSAPGGPVSCLDTPCSFYEISVEIPA